MTREEIKMIIIKEIENYRKNVAWKKPAGSTYQHEMGQACGMVKAFKKMGMLDANDQIYTEILDELF